MERRFFKRLTAFNVFTHFLVILGAIVMFLPFLCMVLTTLKQPPEIYRLPMRWLPDNIFYFKNYIEVLIKRPFARYLLNSFIVAGGCTGASLFISSLAGYAFAKFEFPAKEKIFFLILGAYMIPFEVLLIPLYLMFNSLGLVNTYIALMGPGLISAFGVFLMRQFIETIPNDYIDAARLDGLSEFGIYLKVVLPLAKPALAILVIIKFLWSWNEFLWPLVVVRDVSMKTITLGLSDFASRWYTEYTTSNTACFISIIPILIIFFIFQKYLIKGMTMTGLKG